MTRRYGAVSQTLSIQCLLSSFADQKIQSWIYLIAKFNTLPFLYLENTKIVLICKKRTPIYIERDQLLGLCPLLSLILGISDRNLGRAEAKGRQQRQVEWSDPDLRYLLL